MDAAQPLADVLDTAARDDTCRTYISTHPPTKDLQWEEFEMRIKLLIIGLRDAQAHSERELQTLSAHLNAVLQKDQEKDKLIFDQCQAIDDLRVAC